MSAQHTPGPWKVLEHSWSDTSIVAEGFDHGICLLDINHATEESQEADEALMAANARLIAAAPDLLADLREAAATLRRYEVLHRAKGTTDSDAKAEVNAALAARFEATIAAATESKP